MLHIGTVNHLAKNPALLCFPGQTSCSPVTLLTMLSWLLHRNYTVEKHRERVKCVLGIMLQNELPVTIEERTPFTFLGINSSPTVCS